MDMETVLQHTFLYFAKMDILKMQMEIVSQLLQPFLLLQYAQMDNKVMEKEIVSQLVSKLAVQMDGNLTDKEDVSH